MDKGFENMALGLVGKGTVLVGDDKIGKMLLMGDYEILCNEDQTEWILNDRINPSCPETFDNLHALLRFIERATGEIELESEDINKLLK